MVRVCPRCSESFDDATRFCPRDGAGLHAVADPLLGRVLLGQFELREPLGRGAMGAVYRAWQAGMERWVAVKLLHASLAREPEVRRRFEREARAVARLSHPNIVTVFVVGQTEDGLPYLVMELVEGASLEVALRAGALPPERAVRIARQIASALAEAHAAGIVHRDLKPANVLLAQRRRAADVVKILDFGIAKILGGDSVQQSELTREGAIFGTPHYLSPEQAAGGAIDHRADVYSLGVILYRMVCGRLPFEGTGMQLLVAHINDAPPHPATVVPAVDKRLAAIIMRCLEKRPEHRYASAEALADQLDELAAGGALAPWASMAFDPAAPRSTPDSGTLMADAIAAPVVAAQREGAMPGVAPTVHAKPGQLAQAGSGAAEPPPTVAPLRPESLRPKRLSEPPAALRVADDEDGFALAHEPVVSAPLSLDGTDSLAVVRRRSAWSTVALAFALALVGGGAGFGVYVWRSAGASRTVHPERSAGAAGVESKDAAPVGPTSPTPTPTPTPIIDGEPSRRTVILSEGGYSFQALLPGRIVAGIEYDILIDTWDPAGEPLSVPEIVATIEEPGGIERGLTARPTREPGRYRFARSFRAPGTYYLHLFPPSGNTNVKLWLDVVADR